MPERVTEHLRNAQQLLWEAERRLGEMKTDGEVLEVLADIAAAVSRIVRAVAAAESMIAVDKEAHLHPDEIEFAAIVLSRLGPKGWEHADGDLKTVWRSEAIKLLQRLSALRQTF